jgi:hypothetical protein
MHVQKTHPVGRKPTLYRKYAQMIVDKYECLKNKGVGVSCVYVSILLYNSNYLVFLQHICYIVFFYIENGERSNCQEIAEPRSIH